MLLMMVVEFSLRLIVSCEIAGTLYFSIRNQIEIVIDEACANVIEHFYKEDEHKNLVVTFTLKNDRFIMTIESIGKRIDLKYKKVDLKKHFDARNTRGLGKYIMYTLMDEVTYHYIPQGHQNVLKLVKYI